MTIFQYLELLATFAASTEMPVAEMGALHSASGDEAAVTEISERLASNAAVAFEAGNAKPLISAWMVLHRFKTGEESNSEVLQPLVDLAVSMDETKVIKSPGETERWLTVLEVMLSQIEPGFIEALADFDTLPSKYAMLAIASGNSDRAARWYYTLSEEHEPFFYARLKMGNQLLKRLKKMVNPEDVDPAGLDRQPRIDLVKTYLEHPFAHRLQPFYSKTFAQLIEWKMLTPDELFENGEDLVKAHFRQGMAYLDLAREHRKSGQFEKAMAYLDKGMTTRLQYENRLGCYLLEKVIVHRDAGEIDKAWETMSKVPKEDLDQYNRELSAKLIASLSELDR